MMATTNTITATVPYTTTTTATPYTTTSWTINVPQTEPKRTEPKQTEPKQEEEKKVKTRLGVKTLYKDVRTGEIFRYHITHDNTTLCIKTNISDKEFMCSVCIESGLRLCIDENEPVEIVKATIETCEA